MELFVLSFIFISLAVLGMAVGVLFRGSQLKGTCATLSCSSHALMRCEICPKRHWRGVRRAKSCSHRGSINGSPAQKTARTERQ